MLVADLKINNAKTYGIMVSDFTSGLLYKQISTHSVQRLCNRQTLQLTAKIMIILKLALATKGQCGTMFSRNT